MSKSTKANAIFLATVLVAGIIALSYPSILVGAQAEEYVMDQRYDSYKPEYGMNSYDEKQSYGKDSNSYDKSKDSSVSVKKIKCNNINVNINGFNGLEIGTVPPALTGLTTEALGSDEGEVGANSIESGSGSDGRSSGHDGDSRFICINNNEFNVGGEDGDGTDGCGEAIEACFAESLDDTQETALRTALDATAGLSVEISPGNIVVLNSFADICVALEGLTGLDLTFAVTQIFEAAGVTDVHPDTVVELVACITAALELQVVEQG